MGIRDTRMMARALIERWPITDHQREMMMRVLMSIAADQTNSPRERTSAIKALISADRNNIEQEKLAQIDEHHSERMEGEQLDRIANAAQRLGLARVVDAIAQDRSGSYPAGNVEAGRTGSNLEGRKDSRS
jgi:hypothetical protein